MSTDINSVHIIGRLTRDCELKTTPGGSSVASFSIANNRSYTTNGKKHESVSFFNCVAWGKAGEIIAQYTRKGSQIAIGGRLQQRTWEDKSGGKRSAVEIVVENFQFLSGKSEEPKRAAAVEEPQPGDNYDDAVPANDYEEDIPF